MTGGSQQHWVGRVRPPRVQITYDVEVGGAKEKTELPFVMGVLADLSGQPKPGDLPKLRDRKFVELDPDNFNQTLRSMKPHLAFTVENKLGEGESLDPLKVDLTFESLEDFNPDRVAQRVPVLKELLDLRTKLADLRGSMQSNDKLEELIKETAKSLNDADRRKQLKAQLESEGGSNG